MKKKYGPHCTPPEPRKKRRLGPNQIQPGTNKGMTYGAPSNSVGYVQKNPK